MRELAYYFNKVRKRKLVNHYIVAMESIRYIPLLILLALDIAILITSDIKLVYTTLGIGLLVVIVLIPEVVLKFPEIYIDLDNLVKSKMKTKKR